LIIPNQKQIVMKKLTRQLFAILVILSVSMLAANAQTTTAADPGKTMKTYVIERDIPAAGQFSAEKLKDISKTSCSVLKEMGPSIQWVQSYVTDNKIFCVYKAENIDLLKEHAKKGGFPITAVYEVSSVISPATAN
jgi:Protein of unknown function (DUF4242)